MMIIKFRLKLHPVLDLMECYITELLGISPQNIIEAL